MFVIRCPWCGERDQTEFSYGGEAHIARPTQSETMSDADWSAYVFLRTNPNPAREDARAAMSGNLCRCGAYNHYLNGVMRAAREA